MKRKLSKKSKKIIYSVGAFLLVLSIIAYIAADRFLIEHVAVDLGSVTSIQSSNTAKASSGTNNKSSGAANTVSNTNTGSGTENYTATDMSYTSDNKNINIKKVVTGSGSSQVVYFVADVELTDATQLQSAFAKNKFGTNIIELPSVISEAHNAIFSINGDYYGFRDDGIIIRNGAIYRSVPAREGLAFYKDGTMKAYDETKTTAEKLLADGVWNTLSFGPVLLDEGKIISGIDSVEVDTNFGNHSIQGNQPRTGIGIIDENHFVFVVVDGRSPGYSKGVTLTQFARIFKDLGCKTAYNIDGGGSSEMYFNGNVINNPLGKGQERGTSDILYISKS